MAHRRPDRPWITRHGAADQLKRHRHAEPYVALVLAGSYVEAGDGARIRSKPGTVIAHKAFRAHRNEFGGNGALVLNLPPIDGVSGAGILADVDAVALAAERDVREAAWLVAEQFRPAADQPNDWPDILAQSLVRDPDLRIAGWARRVGLDPASVSRGFARAYGVTPKRFRLEARVMAALDGLPAWKGDLARFAAAHGFSDQAHLTRSMRAITGTTPQRLRAKFVQSGICATR